MQDEWGKEARCARVFPARHHAKTFRGIRRGIAFRSQLSRIQKGDAPVLLFFSSSSYIPESKEKEERGDLSKRIVARLSISLTLSLSPLARSPAIFAFALIVMLSAITDESAEGGR